MEICNMILSNNDEFHFTIIQIQNMNLKIQYASDLHLEFAENKTFIKHNPLPPVGEILILGGDIVPFAIMNKFDDFFTYLADSFAHTFWVPGNHEYYHFDLANKCGVLNEKIKCNITIVNNVSINYQGVDLIFSTLWSQIGPINQWHIERNLNDFHRIKHNGFRFSTEQYNALHLESVDFIKHAVKESTAEKKVIFTHHCPTLLNYPAQYKGNALNEAFASELHDFINSSSIAYWGYGHHHCNTPDFFIHNTQLITNQLGYIHLGENKFFNSGKYITL